MAQHANHTAPRPTGDAAVAESTVPDQSGTMSSPAVAEASRVPVGRLGSVGVLMLLVGAWGGIIPFVGPVFGYSADGASSWHWNLSHALLWLAPGAAACVAAAIVLGLVPFAAIDRGGPGVAIVGFFAVACGAWFVIGPVAWPVLYSSTPVFVHSSPLRELGYQVGYAFGPGVLLAAVGGITIGWGLRGRHPVPEPGALTPDLGH
jgi:hypothetical protein